MKRRKLKKWVVPTIYALIVISAFISVSVINNMMLEDNRSFDYSKSLMKEVTEAVLNEYNGPSFIKPIVSDNVFPKISFYDMNDDAKHQESSLLYYKDTYIPSTGVLYESDEVFDIVAVYDGTIEEVNEDSILGKYIVIKHNDNLRTYYYSLDEIIVSVGNYVSQGTILGKSKKSEISAKNSLLFEVYYQNKAINPENFYVTNPLNLQ